MVELTEKTKSNYFAGIPTTEDEAKLVKRYNTDYPTALQSDAFL